MKTLSDLGRYVIFLFLTKKLFTFLKGDFYRQCIYVPSAKILFYTGKGITGRALVSVQSEKIYLQLYNEVHLNILLALI